MGHKINYQFRFSGTEGEVASLLEDLRLKCLQLRVMEVEEQHVFCWDDLDVMEKLVYAPVYYGVTGEIIMGLGETQNPRRPDVIREFSVIVDDGCEYLPLGLASSANESGAELKTWKYGNSCKTQYSRDFFRSHLIVCQVLDWAVDLFDSVEVSDDTRFFESGPSNETRDLDLLGRVYHDNMTLMKAIWRAMEGSDIGRIEHPEVHDNPTPRSVGEVDIFKL
ncbi:MAG: hypothetical protein ACTSU5_05295 [Promethearchaeota archaeon]